MLELTWLGVCVLEAPGGGGGGGTPLYKPYRYVYSRAFHKLLEIFQTVSRDFSRSCSKNNQKLLFVTKVAQKLLEKNKN